MPEDFTRQWSSVEESTGVLLEAVAAVYAEYSTCLCSKAVSRSKARPYNIGVPAYAITRSLLL